MIPGINSRSIVTSLWQAAGQDQNSEKATCMSQNLLTHHLLERASQDLWHVFEFQALQAVTCIANMRFKQMSCELENETHAGFEQSQFS